MATSPGLTAPRWLSLARARLHLVTMWKLLRHPRTPWPARAVLLLSAIYVLSPVDLVPDTVPLLGQIDDLTLLLLGGSAAMRLAPRGLRDECQAQARAVPVSKWLAVGAAAIGLWLLLIVAVGVGVVSLLR